MWSYKTAAYERNVMFLHAVHENWRQMSVRPSMLHGLVRPVMHGFIYR